MVEIERSAERGGGPKPEIKPGTFHQSNALSATEVSIYCAYLKDLECVWPSGIIDIIYSGDSLSVKEDGKMLVQGIARGVAALPARNCILLEGLNQGPLDHQSNALPATEVSTRAYLKDLECVQ